MFPTAATDVFRPNQDANPGPEEGDEGPRHRAGQDQQGVGQDEGSWREEEGHQGVGNRCPYHYLGSARQVCGSGQNHDGEGVRGQLPLWALEDKTRALEDESDHHHQRSLKGKFMISSLKTNNIIASEEKLKEGGKSSPRYVTELIFNKLGVRVKEEEITSCHHTNSGMMIFRLGDFKPGSSFQQVVTAIKSGAGKDVPNLFVNFALTPRRAALLYEVRQLKKANKITRFMSDSDGSITVVKTDGTKMKVTNAVDKTAKRGANTGGAKVAANGGPSGGAKIAEDGATRRGFGKTFTQEELRSRFVD